MRTRIEVLSIQREMMVCYHLTY